jgi:hypothetical protein
MGFKCESDEEDTNLSNKLRNSTKLINIIVIAKVLRSIKTHKIAVIKSNKHKAIIIKQNIYTKDIMPIKTKRNNCNKLDIKKDTIRIRINIKKWLKKL